MSYEVKDSGTRSNFASGAQRDGQEGKGRMDLLPPETMLRLTAYTPYLWRWSTNAIFAVALLFEKGAKKYAARNWEKGIPLSRYIDSGLRHAQKHLRGDTDEDHLSAAAWNCICGLTTVIRASDERLPKALLDLPVLLKGDFKSGDASFTFDSYLPIANYTEDGISHIYSYMFYGEIEDYFKAALCFLAALEIRERELKNEKPITEQLVSAVKALGRIDATRELVDDELAAAKDLQQKVEYIDLCGEAECVCCRGIERDGSYELAGTVYKAAPVQKDTAGITEN